jgi:hypothetical protein
VAVSITLLKKWTRHQIGQPVLSGFQLRGNALLNFTTAYFIEKMGGEPARGGLDGNIQMVKRETA